jgi:hypothetical protein
MRKERNTPLKSFIYIYDKKVIKVEARNATESNRKLAMHFGRGKRPDGCVLLNSRNVRVDSKSPNILIA